MKKTITLILTLTFVLCTFSFCLAGNVAAVWDDQGMFQYEMTGGNAIITGVNPEISGDVVVPVRLNSFDILYIDEEAFKDCTKITSITFPEKIDGIYFGAFDGCTNLTTVNFNSASYSHKDSAGSADRPVFANCPNLTTVNVGAGVESIPKFLFYGVASLKTVNFAGDMPKIGKDAFTGCAVESQFNNESSSSKKPRPSSSKVSSQTSSIVSVSSQPGSSSTETSSATVPSSSKPVAPSSKPIAPSSKPIAPSSQVSSVVEVSSQIVTDGVSSALEDESSTPASSKKEDTSSKTIAVDKEQNSDSDDGGDNSLLILWICAGAALVLLAGVTVFLLKDKK